jgi:hypothetical protein
MPFEGLAMDMCRSVPTQRKVFLYRRVHSKCGLIRAVIFDFLG